MKILIIEDDLFYSKIYKKKFEVEGFEVETASDGEEGIAKMQSTNPGVVLLDIMMPKLDGFEVLEKVKADAHLQSIPIVMMTNLATQSDIEKAVKKGAVSYIVKSDFTPSQVVAHIKELLKLPPGSPQPPVVVPQPPTQTADPTAASLESVPAVKTDAPSPSPEEKKS